MKKFFVAVAMTMAALAMPVQAQQASDVLNALQALSPEVQKQISTALTPKTPSQLKSAELTSQVSEFGKAIGQGVGEAAKGIGVAASEFFSSGAGMFVAFMIGVKVIGPFLGKVLAAVLLLFVGGWFVRKWANRLTEETIRYNEEKVNIFGNHPIKGVQRSAYSGESAFGAAVMILALLGGFVVIMVNL